MRNQIQKILNLLGVTAIILGIVFSGISHQSEAGRIADFQNSRNVKATNVSNNTIALPWHLEKINADDVWKATEGGANIVVAVLDTGIDENHEDLQGKVIESVNFSSSQTTNDVNGHGTAIAGIIAASVGNLKGTMGIAYNSSLLNVKVAGDDGFVNPEAVAKGIIWATNKGAKVINLSLTLNKSDEAVEEAIEYAWSKGAVIIAAAGNTSSNKPTYPAASLNVIGVAATDENDRLPKWSNRGDWVSVSAPGVDIYSTSPNGKYIYKNGTSFAAALVSGEATLLFAVAEDGNGNGITNDEVKEAIMKNTEMRTDVTNAGRIDVQKAVEQLLSAAK